MTSKMSPSNKSQVRNHKCPPSPSWRPGILDKVKILLESWNLAYVLLIITYWDYLRPKEDPFTKPTVRKYQRLLSPSWSREALDKLIIIPKKWIIPDIYISRWFIRLGTWWCSVNTYLHSNILFHITNKLQIKVSWSNFLEHKYWGQSQFKKQYKLK